jgi:hypothetical protein
VSPPRDEESRPRQESGPVSSTTQHGTRPGDVALLARRHDYALLVVAERSDGVVASQVYTNLTAAERKVTRTRERGLTATLTLIRLVPMSHVVLEDLALVGAL